MNRLPRRTLRLQPPQRGRLAVAPTSRSRIAPTSRFRMSIARRRPTRSIGRKNAAVKRSLLPTAQPNTGNKGEAPSPDFAQLESLSTLWQRLDQPWWWLVAAAGLIIVAIVIKTRL